MLVFKLPVKVVTGDKGVVYVVVAHAELKLVAVDEHRSTMTVEHLTDSYQLEMIFFTEATDG